MVRNKTKINTIKQYQNLIIISLLLGLFLFLLFSHLARAASLKNAQDTLSGQHSTILTASVSASGTVLSVDDTTGFATNDSILLNDDSNDEIVGIDSVDSVAKTITLSAGTTNAYDVGTKVMELTDITHSIGFTNETAIPDLKTVEMVFDSNFSTDNGDTNSAAMSSIVGLPSGGTPSLSGAGTSTLSYTYTSAQSLSADTSISYDLDFKKQPDGTTTNTYYITIKLKDNDGDVIDYSNIAFVIEDGVLVSASVDESLTLVVSGVTGAGNQVTTTATTVPFATLADGTAKTGELHLKVQTNATNGYEVTVNGDANLTSSGEDTIDAVSGSNASPSAWPTVDSSTTSAFGYHSSDEALLSGTAGRFSSADTYAAVSGTASVVADADGPVSGTDTPTEDDSDGGHLIEFKTEIDALQPAGAYYGDVTFVATPRF